MWRKLVFFVGAALGIFPWLTVVKANANLRTLRTFQVGACDGDDLLIECWENTVISVTKVHYSKHLKEGVPCSPLGHLTQNISHSNPPHCVISQPIKAVEDSCKDKTECSIKVSPHSLGGDPCPGFKKYAEVFYKCRPSSFFTRIVCEGRALKLRCPKTLRIVIYNAWYGSTPNGVSECPLQRRHKSEDCHADYVTEAVVDACHGRLKCVLPVNSSSFGSTGCSKKAHLYLKVVYTCVSKDILQDLELDQDTNAPDYPIFLEEAHLTVVTHGHRERDRNGLQLTTPSHHSDDLLNLGATTTKGVDILSDENANDVSTEVNCTAETERKVIGFITEWIAAYKFIRDNKEKFILYVTVSLGAGLLVFLMVLAARLYIQQRRQLKVAKLNISEPLPLTVDEDCSDIDNYDPRHDHSVEVVRYTNMSTVRRQDSSSGPRAPLSHSMNNYYYS